MRFLILISLVSLIVYLFAGGVLLLWVTKLFKIENPSYKKSLLVLIVSGIASVIAGIVVGIVHLGPLSNILVTIATFSVFHYLLKRYYQSSWKKSLGVYIAFGIAGFVIAFLVIIPARLYIFSPFAVAGEAMSPTYNNGDYLLINKFNRNFVRGDVVVFRTEQQPKSLFIKRIIGLPSEKVEIQNGKVLINGQIFNESYAHGDTPGVTSIPLNQDQYFVLGDNRSKSTDSRNFGPIVRSNIEGKVFYKVSGLTK